MAPGRRGVVYGATGAYDPIMSTRRHVLLALLLMVVASGGAAYQATAATHAPAGDGLRLFCPLH